MDSDRLAKIRAKLGQVQFGRGGLAFLKLKEGDTPIRILEGVGDMGLGWWQEAGQHTLPGRRVPIICPQITVKMRCPICEVVSELYGAGDAESKKLAKSIQAGRKFWMNIIDRNAEGRGVQILTAVEQLYDYFWHTAMDPEYGDITDRAEGIDFIIHRVGTGMTDTRYSASAKRKSTPLGTPDQVKDWLETAMDLSPVMLTEDPAEDVGLIKTKDGLLLHPVAVMPYNRLKAEFEGIDMTSVPTGDSAEEKRAKAQQLDEDVPFDGDESDEKAPEPTRDVSPIIRRPRRQV